MSCIGRGVANLGLVLASVVLFLVLAEAVFRFALPASDYPAVEYADGVMRYRPNQHGVYRIRDEIAAPYRINAQGWNARHAAYVPDKPAGALRVAIVGDSFVEAFQVPYDRSLAEQLEGLPGARKLQAYRFAISGAPFSQYLWMLERAVLPWRPDIVVLNLVHNDFDESVRPLPGRYTRSFMTLTADGDRITGERPPQPYEARPSHALVESAALRYLRFNRQVTLGDIQRTLAVVGLAESPPPPPELPPAPPTPEAVHAGLAPAPRQAYDANIDLGRVLARPQLVEAAIEHLVARAAALQRAHGFRLLLLMDGARQAIYEGRDSHALRINRLVADAAKRHGVALVDLQPLFTEAWRRDNKRFDFAHDGHWNERGHAVAARAIRDWIDRQ